MTFSAGKLVQGAVQPAGNKLFLLEIGRAVAALMVVFHHADQATAHFSVIPVERVGLWGQYGVDFFFVLSGFIIFYTHRADSPGLTSARIYLSKRLMRVFVPYLPIALGLMALMAVLQPVANREWSFWATVTLFPMEKSSVLTVAWTLSYELLFYALFLLWYVHRWAFLCGATVWACYLLLVAVGLSDIPEEPAFLVALANPIALEFFCGVLAAYLLPRMRRDWCGPLFVVGLAGLAAVILTWSGNRILVAPPLALIVLAAALVDAVPANRKFWRLATTMGAASYAIYLVHSPVISILARLLEPLEWRWFTFAICAFIGTALGVVYHLVIERPSMRLARTHLLPAPQKRPPSPMATCG